MWKLKPHLSCCPRILLGYKPSSVHCETGILINGIFFILKAGWSTWVYEQEEIMHGQSNWVHVRDMSCQWDSESYNVILLPEIQAIIAMVISGSAKVAVSNWMNIWHEDVFAINVSR